MIVYLDIETLPTQDAGLIAELEAGITPPSSYSKPESIQKWLEENKAAALAEKVAKTSFDGMYGRIACIAWAVGDGNVRASSATCSEEDTLHDFYDSVAAEARIQYHGGATEQGIAICGHNVAGFDLPFMRHRSIVLGIKPPAVVLKAMQAKPWGSEVADTMLMWSADRERRASLDKLCKVLGIPGKDGFDGSMVAATWPTDPQKVIAYCMDDVERVRAIYKRLTFQ